MMPTHLLCAVLAATTAVAPSKPKSASDSTAVEVEHYPVHIVVDTHELLLEQDAEAVAQTDEKISRAVLAMFAGAVDIRKSAGDDAVELRVELSWADFEKSTYAVKVRAALPNGESRQDTFELMGDDFNVRKRLEDNAHTYVKWMLVPEGGDNGAQPQNDPPPSNPPPQEEPRPQPPIKHTLRWVGIGVGVAGLAVGATGGVLFSRIEDHEVLAASGIRVEQRRTYGDVLPPVLMGVGGAALVTGVVLVVIDAKRAKSARRANTTLSPMVAPNHAGVALRGRF